ASDEEKEEEEQQTVQRDVDPRTLDRVKSVQRKPVLKQYRAEVTPFFSVSLNDAFYTHLTVGGTAVFYPHDAFGIGLSGTYFFAQPKTSIHKVVRQGQTSVPATFELPQ